MPKDHQTETDIFATAAARNRALAAQLAERPVEDLVGLVDAKGSGGWPEEDDQWTLSFTFHCWKSQAGPLRTLPLSVRMTGSQEQFDWHFERINSCSIIRIRAQVAEESVMGSPQAGLVEFLGPDVSDPELNEALEELQKPVIHEDRQFGECVLDRRTDWYTAQTEWSGTSIDLHLTPTESGSLEEALNVARSLWQNEAEWTKRIEDCAVQKLLSVKNENWLDEDEDELTAGEFKAWMDTEEISIEPDGSFEFWHNDGDMFFGHTIVVKGSLSDGPTDATIAG